MPIYLDHHATTPCDPAVVAAMLPWFTERFGNASSKTHIYGLQAKAAVDVARDQIAHLLGAAPREIVFTSGATEANNLAILGALRARGGHVVTTAIEHKAVLDPCIYAATQGFSSTVVPVGADGRVDPDAIRAALRPETALVSVMLANNEVGTVQPVGEIAAICHERGVWLHTDATQAAGHLPLRVAELGCDLLSLSAHKMYGPKGVGALYVRKGRPLIQLEPLVHGGGHERGLRPGTLPVPLIVGFGIAAQRTVEVLNHGEAARLARLRDRLLAGLRDGAGGFTVHGSLEHRLPHNLNGSFDGVDAEALLLNTKELAFSTGAACASATLEPSHVLRAMGCGDTAYGSVRFGLGRSTTEAEIDLAIEHLCAQVHALRAMNPEYLPRDVKVVVGRPSAG
jgi:cysteine desulfurase